MAAPSDLTAEELLDRKMDACYTHGDQNGNGVLTGGDARALAARIVAYSGEDFAGPKAQAVFDSFGQFWSVLSPAFDSDGDGGVSAEEWREGLKNTFMKDEDAFNRGFLPMAQAIFTLLDKSGDGKVQEQEFYAFQDAFGSSKENARLAFAKLDRDGSGHLSVEELLTAWREFYTSTDPEAAGNWLFGDVFGPDFWSTTGLKK